MSFEAVSDTGPVRHLWEIDHDRILTLFSIIYLPIQVEMELKAQRVWGSLDQTILQRFRVEEVSEKDIRQTSVRFADTLIQSADVAVIGLATSKRPNVVLTDGLSLRNALEALGLSVVGSVGLLVRAFKMGHFGKEELEAKIDRLFTGSTLYLSRAFKSRVKKMIENFPNERER